MAEKKMVMASLGEIDALGKGLPVLVDDEQLENRLKRREIYAFFYEYLALVTFTFVLVCCYYGHHLCHRPVVQSIHIKGVPQYAIDYAPMVYLHSEEKYLPSDISAQLTNTHPFINLTAISKPPSPLTLSNLDLLNFYGTNGGKDIYLTSLVDATTSPSYLHGVGPDHSGKITNATSCVIIISPHSSPDDEEIVDVFYMYFYAYNLGNTVLGHELGDHIGDWEHTMLRFRAGLPEAMWFSQHGNGQAFTYRTVEKDKLQSLRPIAYSAIGSHANYATEGTHDHTIPDMNLPRGLLQDYTNKGRRWGPTLSAYFYIYNSSSSSLTNPFTPLNNSPLGAMTFKGHWGDAQYLDTDTRQPGKFFGFAKYVSGPTGPGDKGLSRRKGVCPDNGILCIVRGRLGP